MKLRRKIFFINLIFLFLALLALVLFKAFDFEDIFYDTCIGFIPAIIVSLVISIIEFKTRQHEDLRKFHSFLLTSRSVHDKVFFIYKDLDFSRVELVEKFKKCFDYKFDCTTQEIADIYADSAFIINNKMKRKMLYDMYRYQLIYFSTIQYVLLYLEHDGVLADAALRRFYTEYIAGKSSKNEFDENELRTAYVAQTTKDIIWLKEMLYSKEEIESQKKENKVEFFITSLLKDNYSSTNDYKDKRKKGESNNEQGYRKTNKIKKKSGRTRRGVYK